MEWRDGAANTLILAHKARRVIVRPCGDDWQLEFVDRRQYTAIESYPSLGEAKTRAETVLLRSENGSLRLEAC